MLGVVSRHIFYPLWDLKDRSTRLQEYRRLRDSQWLDQGALERLQLERLREITAYAYAHSPYYQSAWGSAPKVETLADLRRLPRVTKQSLRTRLDDLLSRQFAKSALLEAKTGGSTGTSTKVYFDVRCQEWRNAAALRSDGWAGWEPGMLVGALWGTPPVPRTTKEWLRNLFHDRLFFLDTMKLDDDSMGRFVAQIRRRRPGALFGHAHSLFVFARFVEERKLALPRLRASIATSMMLLERERATIERAFGCAVTNRYGCEEVGLIACECERHTGLHVNAEHVYVEILRGDGTPAAPGEEGQVVVTDLVNRGMPLVRYAIEDMACWSARRCECGRGLPLIERIVGRVADFLKHRDGSLVAGVSLVEKTLTAIAGIEQLQIVQTALPRFELNLVATAEFDGASEGALLRVLRDVFGADVDIVVNRMTRIPQERNSKYRFAICRVEG